MNQVKITGRLGADPIGFETKYGSAVNFSIANDVGRMVEGKFEKSSTQWFDVKGFGDVANKVLCELKKGALIQLEGALRVEEFKNKEGTQVKKVVISLRSFAHLKEKNLNQQISKDDIEEFEKFCKGIREMNPKQEKTIEI